jgi:hypothetical protein
MILMWATSISRAIGRGGPSKSRLFWALKWPRAKRVPFGPKKVKFGVGSDPNLDWQQNRKSDPDRHRTDAGPQHRC